MTAQDSPFVGKHRVGSDDDMVQTSMRVYFTARAAVQRSSQSVMLAQKVSGEVVRPQGAPGSVQHHSSRCQHKHGGEHEAMQVQMSDRSENQRARTSDLMLA